MTASRLHGIDALRGAAILTMIVYHLSWDLSWFGFVDWAVASGTGWRIFSGAIAFSFLFLAGVSLVLAHSNGIRWRAFAKRLLIIVAAAVAVSLITYFTFGQTYVRFGILHAIAASSVIALPFVRLPSILSYFGALFLVSLPYWASHSAFDGQALLWTGLGKPTFGSVDYVPLAPWAAATVLGVGVAKTPGVLAFFRRRDSGPYKGLFGRLLVFCGRWSLVIYLLHQPILYGMVATVASAGFVPERSVRMFQESCTENCSAVRGDADLCAKVCTCTVEVLQAEDLWNPLVSDPENPELRANLDGAYAACSLDPDKPAPLTPLR
jgi:uncharacterized membrane protein